MRARIAALPLLDITLGVIVGIFGVARVFAFGTSNPQLSVLIAIGMGVATGLYRRAPLVALGLVWLTAILQLVGGLDIALVQLGAVVVAYGTSRYGRPVTVVLSIVSIPLGAIAAVIYVAYVGDIPVRESGLWQLLNFVTSTTNLSFYDAPTGLVVGFILVTALLAAPWGLGLVLRLREQSRRSTDQRREAEAETARAQQLAELRAGQTRLARDVHDVVGHSLAVIIAQADSTLAMGDDEIGRIRTAVANIGETARRSLGDVRFVLSDDPGSAGGPRADDFRSLIQGVRDGGTDVELESSGAPRPLPPELEVVAYRTLQELLTNALKHGVTATPIAIDLDWGDDELRITMRNTMAETPGPGGGTGLAGLRERLESVGGSFESAADEGSWTAIARVPLRREAVA